MLERYHHRLPRGPAPHLAAAAKKRLAEIGQRLATLGTAFSQNVLADERDTYLVLESEADLAGLPDFLRAAAREAAAEARGLAGKHVITLSRSSVEPFLQYSPRGAICARRPSALWMTRGDNNNATDNKAIIAETVALRAERARLLGFRTYADYRLDDSMAKTPGRACATFLIEVVAAGADSGRWPTATRCRRWSRPRAATSRSRRGTGATTPRSCARSCTISMRRRSSRISSSTKIIEAAFDTAHRLFGLPFKPRDGHPGLASRCPRLGRDRRARASMSACSSAIISRGRRSTAAPG